MTVVVSWLAALEARHLANLTRPELTRALRALSSCYVERREKLTAGAALEGAGKRAAFALFYGPLHFLTVTAFVRARLAGEIALDTIHDLGCGTGVGGAAWALSCAKPPAIAGIDRNGWAVQEANWSYGTLGLRGRARTGDVVKNYPRIPAADARRSAVLLAYAVNELPPSTRAGLLDLVVKSTEAGCPLLIIEPIARGVELVERMGRPARYGRRARGRVAVPRGTAAVHAPDRQRGRTRPARAHRANDLETVGRAIRIA